MIVDALLELKHLHSLKMEMPYEEEDQIIVEKLTERFCESLKEVHIWGIQSERHMATIENALKHTQLRDLSMCIATEYDWDEEDRGWMLLPKLKDSNSTLSRIELNGFFNLSDKPEQYISSFFNPAILRRLELRQCTGYNELLGALAAHPDIHNMEEIVVGSWESCDVSRVSEFVASCRNLKVLLLSLSSFTEEAMKELIPSIEMSRRTLEVLLLDFRCQSKDRGRAIDGTLYYHPTWLKALKSFERIRELGVNLDIEGMNVSPALPFPCLLFYVNAIKSLHKLVKFFLQTSV
jgi:hypothetical protein